MEIITAEQARKIFEDKRRKSSEESEKFMACFEYVFRNVKKAAENCNCFISINELNCDKDFWNILTSNVMISILRSYGYKITIYPTLDISMARSNGVTCRVMLIAF